MAMPPVNALTFVGLFEKLGVTLLGVTLLGMTLLGVTLSFSAADLPIALLMLAIGFHSEAASIAGILRDPKNRVAYITTLLSTALLIPAAAFMTVAITPRLPPEGVLGILIVALVPGGPLSNIAAVIAGANVELNILLTSTEMVISAALLPIGLLVIYPRIVDHSQVVDVPYADQVRGISLVVVPLLLGIACSAVVGAASATWRCTVAKRPIILTLALCVLATVSIAKLRGGDSASVIEQVIPLLAAARLPPVSTAVAAMTFGGLTVAWSVALGRLLPEQPLANRISIGLECGVRDLTYSLVVAMVGLPSLSLDARAQAVIAVFMAWATCNGGVLCFALLSCAWHHHVSRGHYVQLR